MVLLVAGTGFPQTYQVGAPAAAPSKPAKPGVPAQQPAQQLGFGSNIINARLARAAELALQKGNHGLALEYAQRAAQSAPNDPQLWFLLGYAARLDGKYGVSMDAFQHGLRLKPTSVEGLSGLAQTYASAGRTADAERLLRQVIAADPRRVNDLSVLGNIYVRTGNYQGAIDVLGRAEHQQPNAQSELLLAVAYEHLKNMGEASRYLQMAKNRAPGNPDIERSLAGFYRDTGQYGKAVDALKAIRNPKPDVIAELAYTYALNGKLEDAARLYTQAANLLPRDMGLQLSAAQSQVGLGNIDPAEVFLKRAAKIDPNYYRLHAIRGEIAQIQDDTVAAAAEYAAVVKNLPAAPIEGPLYGIQTRMTLQALYQSLDQPDLAQQQLQVAQQQIAALDEQGADRAAFLRLRALIKMQSGQLDGALADMTASLALTPNDPNSLQLDGDLLMKMNRTNDAIAVFKKVLGIDPHSRFALTSLGYASRANGDDASAERYFTQLASDYPSSYVPYLALGDLYTSKHRYKEAETVYARGYKLAPQNSMIVAGGMNAAIESHDLPLAGTWLHRTTEKMALVPQVLREKERYFFFTGDSAQSASIGRQAIKAMARDRDVVVYLGYDLLKLEQYSDLQALTQKYMDVFPKEPDIPLLSGYVYKHDGELDKAVEGFTEALNRDPEVVTAYTNRGYVLNDLHEPAKAAADFEQALKREPKNVEAHMGLAFADLNLDRWQDAVKQTELAEAVAGDSEMLHTIRATAYGRQGLLTKSANEYRAALKFDPTDGSLYLGLGNIYFSQRRYRQSISELENAQKYLPHNAQTYALMARANANLKDRDQALRNIQMAEQYALLPPEKPSRDPAVDRQAVSNIYLQTGEALNTLGDKSAALQRFTKALLVPGSDRVGVRLAIAQLMVTQGHTDDAQRQVALAQMESEAGDTAPATGNEYVEAANLFLQMHEYRLAETYLHRAKKAGAPDSVVRIGLANSYLALGQTQRAAAELSAVKQTQNGEADYQYLLAEASLFQQEHQSLDAQNSFAAAVNNAGEDQTAVQGLLQAGGNEGFRVNQHLSALTDLTVQPIFEDSTIYVLDSKLDSPTGPVPITDVAHLPPPRSSIETNSTTAFRLHFNNLPTNGGYFQIRNARGVISVPATNSVVNRNTTDYSLNFGLNPTVHVGSNAVTFNSGVQGILRRDSRSPVQLDENIFRLFTYATTTSFLNAISADGFFTADFGNFTQTSLTERTYTGAINFRVGSPWARTALITGYAANKQNFNSQLRGNSQNFNTASYIGLTRRFSSHLMAEAMVEDLRSWRVVPFSPIHSAIAQALRPAGTINFSPNRAWDLQLATAYENTRGFHVYDNFQNGISVSYTRPLDRTFDEATGKIHLKYPIRFTGGLRQEMFTNFGQGHSSQLRPYFSLTIF